MDASFNVNFECGGIRINKAYVRSSDHANPYQPAALAVAKAGSLTTRTGDAVGVITMSGGHGFVTGNIVDLYWSGGRRYGVALTVASNELTTADGAHTDGDVLPAQATAITVCLQTVISTDIDGDKAAALAVSLEYAAASTAKGHVHFCEADDTTVCDFDLDADKPLLLDLDQDIANPLTGELIGVCYASHADTVNEATLKIVTLEDATP
jgi:hypothetical protein